MSKRYKRLAVVGGSLFILAMGFIVAEHARGRWSLRQHLSRLEKRGEVLAVPALEPARPLAEDNAALTLMAWSNRLDAILTNHLRSPYSLRFVVPGRVIVTATLTRWNSDREAAHDWEDLRQDIERDADLLAALRKAADLPAYDSGFDYRKGFVDFQLGAVINVKRATQFLHVATLLDLHRGRLNAAQSNLCALVKLAVNQKPEPLVICQLVRQACVAMAFNATWQALQSNGWTDAQLAELQSAWSDCDLPGDMGRAFVMERAMTLDFYRQIRRSRATLNRLVAEREATEWINLTGSLPTAGFWLHSLHVPIWRVAWIDQDALRSMKQWEIMIERERLVRSNSWAALPGRPSGDRPTDWAPWMALFVDREQLGWYDQLRYLFSAESFAITDLLLRKTTALQTQQQMALTAIALARYRAAHGGFPQRLEALIPELLPASPRDGMNGQPLRYRPRPEGGFILYSVGFDGMDDGGDPSSFDTNRVYRQIWDGRDAVWPVAASAEATEAAMRESHE